MLDTVTAYAPTGVAVDPIDGMEKFTYTSQGSTPAKIQTRGRGFNTSESRYIAVAGVRRIVLIASLHLPISAPRPEPGEIGMGWEYEVTAIGAVSDPTLLGRRYLIVEVSSFSTLTARRCDVVDIT